MRSSIENKQNFISQPSKINIPLKYHQLKNVTRMIKKENSIFRFTSNIDMGILGDKVGAGKSLSILALIAKKPNCTFKKGDRLRVNNKFIHPIVYQPSHIIKSNLIIVPHGIFKQWQSYLTTQTTLTFHSIGAQRHILQDITEFDAYDIILCKSTMIKWLVKVYPGMCVSLEDYYSHNTVQALYKKHNISKFIHNLTNAIKTIQTHYKYPVEIKEDIVNKLSMDIQEFVKTYDNTAFKEDAKKIKSEHKFSYFAVHNKMLKGTIWNRVIIDEAQSIDIKTLPYGCFNWLITSSLDSLTKPMCIRSWVIRNIFHKNTSLRLHDYNEDIRNTFINTFCIKNSDSDIEQSFKIPPPVYHYVNCYTPLNVRILSGVLDPTILQCLAADNISQAIQKMGCDVKTERNVIRVACVDIKTKISKQEEDVKRLSNNIIVMEQSYLGTMDETLQQSLRIKIRSEKKHREGCKNKIQRLQSQIQTIEKRIKDYKNESCPICLDTIKKPTHVTCCKQLLCFKCITMCIARKPKCPLCRSPLDKYKLLVIDNDCKEETLNAKKTKLPTKLEKIIQLITEKKDGRFLVFSSHDASFFNIISELNKHNISYKRLMGHVSTIQKAIDQFTSGQLRVLMLNTKNYGNGLNLQMASDIILYHRMNNDMEQQVVGRGQRLGRTTPLHIHYLCHNNELPQQLS